MRNSLKLSLVLALGAVLGACAPEILPPTQHAPTSPAEVKLFQIQPAKYEKLATLTYVINPDDVSKWAENADATAAFDQLKNQAAKMGANGLLLMDDTKQAVMSGGVRVNGLYYTVPGRQNPRAVIVQAIFVVQE